MIVNFLEETEKSFKDNNKSWDDVFKIICKSLGKESTYEIDINNFKEVAAITEYENDEFMDKIPYDIVIYFKDFSKLIRVPSLDKPEGWKYISYIKDLNTTGVLKVERFIDKNGGLELPPSLAELNDI